jgi:pimeloyl-ACP methyl ester carboxylesterase
MPLADIGTAELSYERGGSGPPLLLIMGMSGTFLHWREPFMEELRRDFETIVYDHRGVGESTRLEGEITIAELARDAAGLLEALGLDAVHVLGISMGGMIAQELALARPELIGTLALGCTYCGGAGSSLMGPDVLRRLAAAISSGDRALAVRAMWGANVSPGFAADEEAFAEFRAIAARRAVASTVIMAQMQACAAHDTSTRLRELRMPTLIVHGTADEMIPVANAELIHRYISGSRLEILDGVGHLFFWEQPLHTAELVRAHAAVRA